MDILVSAVSVIIVGIILILKSKKSKKVAMTPQYIAEVLLLTLTMVLIFNITGISPMSGFHTNIVWSDISLMPFVDLSENKNIVQINLIGNILLFMPLGFMLPLL